jgi:hypothetical protein
VDRRPLGFYHFTGFDCDAHRAKADRNGKCNEVLDALIRWYQRAIEGAEGDRLARLPWRSAATPTARPSSPSTADLRYGLEPAAGVPKPVRHGGHHTKRSGHRTEDDAWRKSLLSALLDTETAPDAIRALGTPAGVGIVRPAEHILSIQEFAGANRERVHLLATTMESAGGLSATDASVAGSMILARTAALLPLLRLPIDESDFEPEVGQIAGNAGARDRTPLRALGASSRLLPRRNRWTREGYRASASKDEGLPVWGER